MIGSNSIKSKALVLYTTSLIMICVSLTLSAQTPTETQQTNRVASSIALVLVGDGDGVVIKIAPAVVMKADGVLLVPYHVVKDAKEIQVRLKSGEIFDDVVLLGTDERRDVAAIKIQASDLSVTAPTNFEELKTGETMSVFTHRPGKLWSSSNGKLTGIKMADEVAGAGQGFRIIQFEAAIGTGVDGGILIDGNGNPVGLVTASYTSTQKTGVAVPISNLKSLANSERSKSFGSGKSLNIPTEAGLNAANNPSTDPKDLLMNSKTVYVDSNTSFFTDQQLISELNKRTQPKEWGWVLTTGSWEARNKTDLIIELEHQIFTFNFTFTIRHRKSSILITADKVIITDGATGAPKMVDKMIKNISGILNLSPPKGK